MRKPCNRRFYSLKMLARKKDLFLEKDLSLELDNKGNDNSSADAWKLVKNRHQHAVSPPPRRQEFGPVSSACRELESDGNGSESRIKRSVWYVGKLRTNTTEDKLRNYIQQRADELQVDVTVFEAKVLHRDHNDMHCSGRIMVDCASSPVVGNKSFWPRPIYTRPW